MFGPTRNPWNPALSAGGSSGGSAAALAVGSCWLATGTDLGGSLRNPAGWCGVVGLRTTPGLVAAPFIAKAFEPLPPPAPSAWRLASVGGPMGRGVRDAALLLDAMAAGQASSSCGSSSDGGSGGGSYEAAAVSGAREGAAAGAGGRPLQLRVAFSPDLGGITPVDQEVAQICRAAAAWFSSDDQGQDAGGGSKAASSSGGVVEACPDLTHASRMFHVLRAVGSAVMVRLLDLPGAEKILKPECLWQVRYLHAESIGRSGGGLEGAGVAW